MKKHAYLAIFAFFLALSQVLGAGEAKAANGDHRFCDVAIQNPTDLENRLSESLSIDPTGNHAMKGCRATPVHFLAVWKTDFAQAHLATVQDLLPFVREFKPMVAKKEMEYNSACLRERPDRVYDVVTGCTTRPVRSGETVYAWHGKPAMMSSCANPGVIEVPPIVVSLACVEVDFWSDTKIPTRFAYIGPKAIPTQCVRLHIASEQESRTEMPNECPDAYTKVINGHLVQVVCDWREDEAAVTQLLGVRSQVQNVSGSFYGRVNGMNVMYLPKEALNGEFAVCWTLPDGRIVTKGVRRGSFVNGVAVIPEAQVVGAR